MTLNGETLVGRRVECDGHRGTVRYDGDIAGAGAGRWLGVEWDDPSRGKHDGSHQSVKYFDTKYPTSGSFVRLHKVNLGRSCTEAVLEQYESQFEAQLTSFKTGNKTSVKTAEFVGFEKHLEKISNHEALQIVVVSNLAVRNGDERLSELCPRVVELDVSKNLLSNVDDLASIVEQIPSLETLAISHNFFSSWDTSRSEVFAKIQNLVASNMSLRRLDDIALLFPNLLSLKVPRNELSHISLMQLPHLIELDLDHNQIALWDQVLNLSRLPCLRTLHLNGNCLNSINVTPADFPCLRTLFLSGNQISEWASISALQVLPSLDELIFKDNPVLKSESPETNRQIIICRLDRLKMLDKVKITVAEKKGAAFDYLKKYGKEFLAATNDFHQNHPCYQRLVDLYGAPEESELVGQPSRLKNLLITIVIECPQLKENGAVEKKVPRTMKLQRLRGMLPKLLPSAPRTLRLSYVSQDKPDIKYEFDNDLKDLAYYSIQDHDRILVEW